VRIDLNGHRVEGARFNHFIGIDDSGGFDRVRIVDGADQQLRDRRAPGELRAQQGGGQHHHRR